MKSLILTAVFLFTALLAGGEEVLAAFTNASWVTPHWRKFTAMNEFLAIRGWVDIHSKRSFEVDPDIEYELSGVFRTPEAQKGLSRFEFGFDPIDSESNVILPHSVIHVKNTFSVLAEPAKIGDSILKVKKTGKWRRAGYIVFNAKQDLSDLPNRDNAAYSKIEDNGKILTLTLKKPLTKAYPAGCMVRNHVHSRLWTVNRSRKVPKKWTKFSARIKGIDKNISGNNKWWPGTERARIFLLIPSKKSLEFKDVTVRKVSEQELIQA